jgi:hypothetical protein
LTELLPAINVNFGKWKLLVTHSFAVPPYVRNVKHCEQVPRNEYARYELRVASDACGVTGEWLMTVAQSARLLRWVIAGLILLGVLLYFLARQR